MTFAYQKMLRDNAVKESGLPQSIREAINALHELEYDLDDDSDDNEIVAIQADLKKLDREICQLIVEELDEESDEDMPVVEIKAGILHNIYSGGIKKISVAQLKKAGYPVPAGSRWNEKVGEYTIKKNLYEEYALISR
jgi:hypothetical protein